MSLLLLLYGEPLDEEAGAAAPAPSISTGGGIGGGRLPKAAGGKRPTFPVLAWQYDETDEEELMLLGVL